MGDVIDGIRIRVRVLAEEERVEVDEEDDPLGLGTR